MIDFAKVYQFIIYFAQVYYSFRYGLLLILLRFISLLFISLRFIIDFAKVYYSFC